MYITIAIKYPNNHIALLYYLYNTSITVVCVDMYIYTQTSIYNLNGIKLLIERYISEAVIISLENCVCVIRGVLACWPHLAGVDIAVEWPVWGWDTQLVVGLVRL